MAYRSLHSHSVGQIDPVASAQLLTRAQLQSSYVGVTPELAVGLAAGSTGRGQSALYFQAGPRQHRHGD
jgi:hypothetical protein